MLNCILVHGVTGLPMINIQLNKKEREKRFTSCKAFFYVLTRVKKAIISS